MKEEQETKETVETKIMNLYHDRAKLEYSLAQVDCELKRLFLVKRELEASK